MEIVPTFIGSIEWISIFHNNGIYLHGLENVYQIHAWKTFPHNVDFHFFPDDYY